HRHFGLLEKHFGSTNQVHFLKLVGIFEISHHVVVPVAALRRKIDLDQRNAYALIKHRQRVTMAGIDKVSGIPEATRAPAHELTARGDKSGAIDVELKPKLIEQELKLLRLLAREQGHLLWGIGINGGVKRRTAAEVTTQAVIRARIKK